MPSQRTNRREFCPAKIVECPSGQWDQDDIINACPDEIGDDPSKSCARDCLERYDGQERLADQSEIRCGSSSLTTASLGYGYI